MGKQIPNQGGRNDRPLSKQERSVLGLDESDPYMHVNLRYIDTDHECFSDWQLDELKSFSSFIATLNSTRWGQVSHSNGLGYKIHKNRNVLPKHSVLDKTSQDITFFELRVTQKARVHGFRSLAAFYLVWLDRNHEVYKM